VILALWGADPVGLTSTKIGKAVSLDDIIIQSNFGFNIFTGFMSTGSHIFRFPIEFTGHPYNSAAATAQPVISVLDVKRNLTEQYDAIHKS